MRVRLASPMRSYTGGAAKVDADGADVAAVLADLDRRFPGLAFRIVDEQGRIRPHVNVWLDGERVRDPAEPTAGSTELTVMQALSGGGTAGAPGWTFDPGSGARPGPRWR